MMNAVVGNSRDSKSFDTTKTTNTLFANPQILVPTICMCFLLCINLCFLKKKKKPKVRETHKFTFNNFYTYCHRKLLHGNCECAICLNEHEELDMIKRLPCGHEFHLTCIHRWLFDNGRKFHKVCPMCKQEVFSPLKTRYSSSQRVQHQEISEIIFVGPNVA